MSLTDEVLISNLINEATFYVNHQDENETFLKLSQDCLNEIDNILKKNIRQSFQGLSMEVIIQFCESCLLIPNKHDLAVFYIELFFQRNASQGQYYIRALLLKARLVSMAAHNSLLKSEEMIGNLQNSLSYIQKAIDIINKPENKIKYGFLIYNASISVYYIIRPMLKPNWEKFFVDILDKIDRMFEEVDEADYNWRCRFTWLLFHCMYDGDKKAEAFKLLEKLWDTTTKKGDCDFQDSLLRLRIHVGRESKPTLDAATKNADQAPSEKAWKPLVMLQKMKSGLTPEAQIEKELINLINQISSAVLPGNEVASTNRLSPVLQERLAEAGRVAIQFGLINIADSITNFLSRVRQLHPKSYILHEYNKAELFIKKAGPLIDNKTGMRLNSIQIKKQEVERRVEALKIMEKAMVTNKKANDPDLIYEGAVLVWNISLPFLNSNYRSAIIKAFQSTCALLEQLQCVDHALRVNFYIELAKTLLQDDFNKAEEYISKALSLDYSIPLAKVPFKIDEGEDLGLYQRPYDKYLNNLKDKIRIKKNIYGEPKNEIERVIIDLEQAQNSSQDTKIIQLQKCLGSIVNMQEQEYIFDVSKDLVEEEINKEKLFKKQEQLYFYKQKQLLAGEIANLAFEWNYDDLANKACEFVCSDQWDPKNASEMILAQVECYYIQALIIINSLIKDNIEIAFAEPIRADETLPNEGGEMTNEKKEQILQLKRKMCAHFLKGLKLAESIKQTWLVFNGAINIWNSFLPIFRNPINDTKLLPEITNLLKEFFEVMKNSLKEIEKKQINDYDIDTKIQVLANIGLIYGRLMEGKGQHDEVMRVCEALLLTPLSPHTRKLINSIKARVSSVAKTSNKQLDKKQGGKQVGSSSDSVLFDVVSQLEIIQNSTIKAQTLDLIKKCFETLLTWSAKENDETELELHAELWARLARLALNEENSLMYKYSLRCVQNSLSLLQTNDLTAIPPSRLRWYSLAEYIYSENLIRMITPETQETESQARLLFFGLKHAIEAANKGLKAGINSLVLDASKQVWNICARLEESAQNRKHLIKPVFSTLFYLKECREKSEPDLILLLAQLLFKSSLENEDYKLGEQAADMVFELIPKEMQKPVWEAKMIFMSKQGKNEQQAISNMKEADASLQAKVWIRLARASNNLHKQYSAYTKAIEILKKESSVEIVEILIEFSEWLLRNGNDKQLVLENLNYAADTLIEIEMDEDDDDEEQDEEQKSSTIFSRSTRGKKSQVSKASKQKSRVTAKKSQKNTIKTNSKKNEQKSQESSKQSQNQRLTRAANVRTSKTIKSKQSKSIFSQREEEPDPESLNCAHYERLLRIHAMLAMIAESMEEQIQFALDGKVFLTKIIEISFKTLNQIEENASKYTNIIDEKAGAKQQQVTKQGGDNFVPKYLMPTNIEEWTKLNFSKEFIEKVKTYEDFNFMGKFLFEKAQLTYTYIDNLIKFFLFLYRHRIFENAGLQVHCVPLYVFQRFFVKEILGNQYLQLLTEVRFGRCLHQIGFHTEANLIWGQSGAQKLKLTEHEKKFLLSKTESSIIQANRSRPTDVTEHNLPQPLVISDISVYQIWSELGRELVYWGEAFRAKEMLNEAFQHAKIVQDLELMGEILLETAHISYLEGEYKESLEKHKMSHKMIKNVSLWERSAIETFRTLCKLGKYDDIKAFLKKMIEILIEVINKPVYQPNKLQIEQSLGTLYILFGRMMCKELQKEFLYDVWKQTSDYLEKGIKCLQHGGFKIHQMETIVNSLNKLVLFIRGRNYTILNDLEVYYKVLNRIQTKILCPLEQLAWNMLKYTLLIERESESIRSPLVLIHGKIKVLLGACYTELGLIKYIRRQEQLPDFSIGDEFFIDEQINQNLIPNSDEFKKDKDELLDQVKELPKEKDGPLQKFLNKLTITIQKAIEPLPQRFESFEKAEAILLQALKQIDQQSFWYLIGQVELARVMRLLSLQKGELNDVWPSKRLASSDSIIGEDDETLVREEKRLYYKDKAFKLTRELAKEIESKSTYMLKKSDNKTTTPIEFWIFQCKQFNVYLKMLQEQFVELTGQQIPEVSFEYVGKLQHFAFNEQMLQMVKQAFFGKHKLVTYIRFNKMIYQNLQQVNQDAIQLITNEGYRLWQNIMVFPDYKEIVSSLLPLSSGYVLLQMSQNKQFLYFGYMQNNKQQIPKYVIERIQMQEQTHKKLQDLKSVLTQIKTNLVKTPIIQEQDFIKLEDDMEKEYQRFSLEMSEFFSFIGIRLDALINQQPQTIEEAQEQLDPKQQGKQPAKQPDKGKKAGKDELAAYESPLEPTAGGVESIVIMMDSGLFSFPLEYLPLFAKIRAISRDFSLMYLGRRLKSVNYQPALNNGSKGIEKDKLKFITYDFKEEETDIDYNAYNSSNLVKEMTKVLPPAFKLEGTHSSQRLASLGELQKYASTGSALFYFGSAGILNILTPKVILDLSEINQIRYWAIFDKMNAKKTLIDKFTSLDPDGEKTPILEQQFKVSAFLSLIEVATIFTTQWAPQVNEFLKAFDTMVKGILEEIYISATLRKYREPQIFFEDQNGNRVDQKLIEQSQQALSKDAKKGGKQPLQSKQNINFISLAEQKLLTEEELKNLREVSVNKKKLYTENFIFLGIPVLRAF